MEHKVQPEILISRSCSNDKYERAEPKPTCTSILGPDVVNILIIKFLLTSKKVQMMNHYNYKYHFL